MFKNFIILTQRIFLLVLSKIVLEKILTILTRIILLVSSNFLLETSIFFLKIRITILLCGGDGGAVIRA
jgi:hypothetical protein